MKSTKFYENKNSNSFILILILLLFNLKGTLVSQEVEIYPAEFLPKVERSITTGLLPLSTFDVSAHPSTVEINSNSFFDAIGEKRVYGLSSYPSPIKLTLFDSPSPLPCTDSYKVIGNIISKILIDGQEYTLGKEDTDMHFDLAFEILLEGYNSSTPVLSFIPFILKVDSETNQFIVEQDKLLKSESFEFGNESGQINTVILKSIEIIHFDRGSEITSDKIKFVFSLNLYETHKPDYDINSEITLATKWLISGNDYFNNYRIDNENMNALDDLFIWSLKPNTENQNISLDCVILPKSFEVQILRLYNQREDYNDDERNCYSIVDWAKATTLIVPPIIDSDNKYYKLKDFIPTEGSGYYIYRVRPIYDYFPGGVNNNLNWGRWNEVWAFDELTYPDEDFTRLSSCEYKNNDIIDIDFTGHKDHSINLTSGSITIKKNHTVIYIDIDESINWKHQRIYSSNSQNETQFNENISYFDNKLLPRQTLTRSLESDLVIGQQSLYDKLGRNTINTLPIPIQKDASLDNSGIKNNSLKYRKNLALSSNISSTELFKGIDPTNLSNPLVINLNSGRISDFYDGNNTYSSGSMINSNYPIPNSSDRAYSQSIVSDDGLNRIELSSQPGNKFSLTDPNDYQDNHALEYFYTKATEEELVKLFGSEAPNPQYVTKEIVTEYQSNKVSVVYKDFQNKVLATAIKTPADYSLLSYGESFGEEFTVTNIFDKQINNGLDFIINDKIVLPISTEVDLTYNASVRKFKVNFCDDLESYFKSSVNNVDDYGEFTSSYNSGNGHFYFPPNVDFSNSYIRSNNSDFTIGGSGNLFTSPTQTSEYNTIKYDNITGTETFSGTNNLTTKLTVGNKTQFNFLHNNIDDYYTKKYFSPTSEYKIKNVFDLINDTRIAIIDDVTDTEEDFDDFIEALTDDEGVTYKYNNQDSTSSEIEQIWTTNEEKTILNGELGGCIEPISLVKPNCLLCDIEKYKIAVDTYDYAKYILDKLLEKFKDKTIYGIDGEIFKEVRYDDGVMTFGSFVNGYKDDNKITITQSESSTENKKLFTLFFVQNRFPLSLYFQNDYKEINLSYNLYDGFNTLINNLRTYNYPETTSTKGYSDEKLCFVIEKFTEKLLNIAVSTTPNILNSEYKDQNPEDRLYFNKSINTLDMLFEALGRAFKGNRVDNTIGTSPTSDNYITNAHQYYKKWSDEAEKKLTGSTELIVMIQTKPSDLTSPTYNQDVLKVMQDDDYTVNDFFAAEDCDDNVVNEKRWESYYKEYCSKFITEDIKSMIDKELKGKGKDENTSKDILKKAGYDEYIKILTNDGFDYKNDISALREFLNNRVESINSMCREKRIVFEQAIQDYLSSVEYDIIGVLNTGKTNYINKVQYDRLVDILVTDCHKYNDMTVNEEYLTKTKAGLNPITQSPPVNPFVYLYTGVGVDEGKRATYRAAFMQNKPLEIKNLRLLNKDNTTNDLNIGADLSPLEKCDFISSFDYKDVRQTVYLDKIKNIASLLTEDLNDYLDGLTETETLAHSYEDREAVYEIIMDRIEGELSTNYPELYNLMEDPGRVNKPNRSNIYYNLIDNTYEDLNEIVESETYGNPYTLFPNLISNYQYEDNKIARNVLYSGFMYIGSPEQSVWVTRNTYDYPSYLSGIYDQQKYGLSYFGYSHVPSYPGSGQIYSSMSQVIFPNDQGYVPSLPNVIDFVSSENINHIPIHIHNGLMKTIRYPYFDYKYSGNGLTYASSFNKLIFNKQFKANVVDENNWKIYSNSNFVLKLESKNINIPHNLHKADWSALHSYHSNNVSVVQLNLTLDQQVLVKERKKRFKDFSRIQLNFEPDVYDNVNSLNVNRISFPIAIFTYNKFNDPLGCEVDFTGSNLKSGDVANISECSITYNFEDIDIPDLDFDTEKKRLCYLDFLDRLEKNILSNIIKSKHEDHIAVTRAIDEYYKELPKNVKQELKATYGQDLTYFTLYYYDRAGNLVKTVPPKGVHFANDREELPAHTHYTKYEYNSVGQLIRSRAADENQDNRFWYNRVGQLRYSQTAKQLEEGKVMYNLYDRLGRIIESAEIKFDIEFEDAFDSGEIDAINAKIDSMLHSEGVDKIEDREYPDASDLTMLDAVRVFVTQTDYSDDPSIPGFPGFKAIEPERTNLLRKVNNVLRDADGDLDTKEDQVITYYSYDLHGNVDFVIQDLPVSTDGEFRLFANTQYHYEPVSGRVLGVAYNYYESDSYVQNYEYDRDGRLVEVKSSRYNHLEDKEAGYKYYPTGELQRIETGEDKLQGTDYIYTLQGQLKSINHPDVSVSGSPGSLDIKDPGKDGLRDLAVTPPNNPNMNFAKDAFSTTLNYYSGDFEHTTDTRFDNSSLFATPTPQFPEHFDGKIAIWETNSLFFDGTDFVNNRFDQGFLYDQINRLKHSNFYEGSTPNINTKYQTNYAYDANGNMDTLLRWDGAGRPNRFDELKYTYSNGSTNNKLTHIDDAISASAIVGDLEDQDANNYEYDASGNLTKDTKENISGIEWTPDGKIKKITKNTVPPVVIEYLYDAMGQRVTKNVTTTNHTPPSLPIQSRHQTIYARDANGQVMAIYERTFNPTVSNDPGGKIKFKLKLEWVHMGCVGEVELEEGVNFEFNNDRDSITLSTINGSLTVAPCIGYSFQIAGGNKLGLNPPFNEKEASYGWGGYRQQNKTNTYRNGAPQSLTILTNGIPAEITLTIDETSVEYSNVGMLPKIAEWHVYGNEQQGRFMTKYPEHETYYGYSISEDIRNNIFSRQLGKKSYELKDHLGNVRVTFSDIKMPTDVASQPFTVDLLSRSEYYPFGMKIDALSWNETGARYGYNGTHEQELAINPEGNYLDFGDFGYDTRTARRQNLDPMFAAYPHLSGYATFNNNPIYFSDPTGWEGEGQGEEQGQGQGQGDGKDCNPLIPDQSGAENVGLTVSNNNNEVKPKSNSGSNAVQIVKNAVSNIIDLGKEFIDFLDQSTDGGVDDLYLVGQSQSHGNYIGYSYMIPDFNIQMSLSQLPTIVHLDGTEATTLEITEAYYNTFQRIRGFHRSKQPPGTNTVFETVVDDEVMSIYNRHPAEATVEGVYILSEALEIYVGQSQNFAVRLSKHFGVGGLFEYYQTAERILIKMPGSTKDEREIYEQYVIRQFGGKDNLLNQRNPYGGRMEKFNKEYENVIKKYNLPRF